MRTTTPSVWQTGAIVLTFVLHALAPTPALAASDNAKIKKACYGERLAASTTCLNACRALVKAHGAKQAYSNLSSSWKYTCYEAVRQAKKESMDEETVCSSRTCALRFIVVDPYASELRFKGPEGYSLIKTYRCSGSKCLSTWELLTPKGEKAVFEKCAGCRTIQHVGGALKGASLVNAGGLEGEDILLRLPEEP